MVRVKSFLLTEMECPVFKREVQSTGDGCQIKQFPSDIVERLLNFTPLKDADLARLMLDAAEEIQRLREVCAEQSATIRHLTNKMEQMMKSLYD